MAPLLGASPVVPARGGGGERPLDVRAPRLPVAVAVEGADVRGEDRPALRRLAESGAHPWLELKSSLFRI